MKQNSSANSIRVESNTFQEIVLGSEIPFVLALMRNQAGDDTEDILGHIHIFVELARAPASHKLTLRADHDWLMFI
jgi:hypothetical protein